MNIDIRKSIKNNFKGASSDEIKTSIDSSIKSKDEITLPDLGVFLKYYGIILMKMIKYLY